MSEFYHLALCSFHNSTEIRELSLKMFSLLKSRLIIGEKALLFENKRK